MVKIKPISRDKRDFAAGAHICYTDAVFTADCYALYLSRKFDRELRASSV